MADIWYDVDTALTEVPVNLMPLIDDTDFKSIEGAVAYNAAGMALFWHFCTTDGVYNNGVAVTPTTAGAYDWTDHGTHGIYTIEIPASGGASINNDTEGFGWFTGVATGILPWRGPVCGFRAAALNNSLIDAGTTGLLAPTTAARTLDVTATGAAGIDWGNVENPTTALNLSGTNIDVDQVVASVSGAVGSVTGHTAQTGDAYARIGAPAGASVSADIAAMKVDTAAILVDTATIDTAGEIAAAVWSADATTYQTQGTFGQAIGDPVADTNSIFKATVTDAGLATVGLDVVEALTRLPDATAGAAGGLFIAGSNAATSITTALTANITGNLTGSVASVTGAVGSVTGAVGSVTGLTAADVGSIKTKTDYLPSVAAGAAGGVFIAGSNAATSITTALTANITGNVSGSVGSVTGAVGSVTGAVGSVTGAVGSVTGAVGSVTGLTAADVGAIKTQTDKLAFTVANQVDANTIAVSGDATAADNLETAFDDAAGPVPWLGIIDQGTAQSATGTTLVLRAAAALADDTAIGATLMVYGSTQGYWQTRVITDYVLSTDTATVDTWTVTPAGTITYKVFATSPASATSIPSVNVKSINGANVTGDGNATPWDGA